MHLVCLLESTPILHRKPGELVYLTAMLGTLLTCIVRVLMLRWSSTTLTSCTAWKAGQKPGGWAAEVMLGRAAAAFPLMGGRKLRRAYAAGPCCFARLSMLLPALQIASKDWHCWRNCSKSGIQTKRSAVSVTRPLKALKESS